MKPVFLYPYRCHIFGRFSKRHGVRLIVLACVCWALFVNTLPNRFATWTDTSLIAENQYIKDWRNIPLFFSPHYWNCLYNFNAQGLYRPLRTTLLALDYRLWGPAPAGYHLTNLMLHMMNVFLVYALGYFLCGAKGDKRRENDRFWNLSLLTALLFAAHPVHTETVSFIKNRDELLACCFFLLSTLFFMQSLKGEPGRKRTVCFLTALLCGILAFLSKEMALILPLILVLYILHFVNAADRFRVVWKTTWFWLLVVLFFWFRHTALQTSMQVNDALAAWEKALAVWKIFGYHFYLLCFPVHSNVMHSFVFPGTIFSLDVFLPALALLLLCAVVLFSCQKSKLLSFGISWLLLTQLPAASLGYLAARPVAEQRLYLPSIGFCLLLAMGIDRFRFPGIRFFSRANRLFLVVLSAVFIFYSVQTMQRNGDWQNKLTLWRDCVKKSPRMAVGHNILGLAYVDQGEYARAIDAYQRGLQIRQQNGEQELPVTADIYNNLGVAHGMQNDFDKARPCLEKALEIRRKHLGLYHEDTAQTLANLGLLYYHQKNHKKALQYLQRARAVFLQRAGETGTGTDLQKIQTILDFLGQAEASRERSVRQEE